MENINIKLRQNDPKAHHMDDLDQGLNGLQKKTPVWEQVPNKKEVQKVWEYLDLINEHSDCLKSRTAVQLKENYGQLLQGLDKHFDKYRKDLMADSLKKKQTDEDSHHKEQSLNNQLEIVTQIAQDRDKTHRKLKSQEARRNI